MNITNLVFPSSLTKIGEGAFYECSGLAKITFKSDNKVEIGENAFMNCFSLSNIKNNNNLSIQNNSFINCVSLNKKQIQDLLINTEKSELKPKPFGFGHSKSLEIVEEIAYLEQHKKLLTDIIIKYSNINFDIFKNKKFINKVDLTNIEIKDIPE